MTISQTRFATQQRRAHIAQGYLQKKMQSEIAREVGVTQQQISLDLKVIQAAWLQSSLRDFDAMKAEQLAIIDLLEQESWSAWDRSKQPREITLTEATEGSESPGANGTRQSRPPTRKASVRREGQGGDPRFLERIQKCIEQRCTILGLEAPKKIAPTSPDGTTPYQPLLTPPDDTFFAALATLFQQLGPQHVNGSVTADYDTSDL